MLGVVSVSIAECSFVCSVNLIQMSDLSTVCQRALRTQMHILYMTSLDLTLGAALGVAWFKTLFCCLKKKVH